MALTRRKPVNGARTSTRSSAKKKVAEAPTTKRRGAVEESDFASAKDMKSGYINKLKIETAKQKLLITFPLTSDGVPRLKTLQHFTCKFGTTLSDGKWHQFQLPEDDDVFEQCKAHKSLELTTTRFALVAVMDTDQRGIPATKDVGYTFAWLKVTDYVKNSILDVIEESDSQSLEGIDLIVKLNAKDNALKMQDMVYSVKGKSLAFTGKLNVSKKEFLTAAEEAWEGLENRVVSIEDDDTILALIDDYEEEPEVPRRSSAKGKENKAPTRSRRFNSKDF